ncbi:SEED MATURATION PROTEIN 1-like [Pyrus x bretschneideri]|uniref:SEED MATURATION PROTEIN 1-like n=1 Tax=Pyrus x bretschneideri TaxID=225117 RepID=UPI00202F42E4|nr:SEED MATURATION PROTEIN 1-like [Pyrus x bretschneideri]
MAKSWDDIKYATSQARLDEDEVVRTTAYKHGTPLEGGKIAESEPVDFFQGNIIVN